MITSSGSSSRTQNPMRRTPPAGTIWYCASTSKPSLVPGEGSRNTTAILIPLQTDFRAEPLKDSDEEPASVTPPRLLGCGVYFLSSCSPSLKNAISEKLCANDALINCSSIRLDNCQ